MQAQKLKLLFLCTGNSCRSQMAEGWTRRLKADLIEPYSAGVEVSALDPRAVAAMKEKGVDISSQHSKPVQAVMHIDFDDVVTLCGHARETCPVFPGKTRVVHRGFDDPPQLAESAGNEEAAMSHYRRVRDEIRAFVERLPGALEWSETEGDT